MTLFLFLYSACLRIILVVFLLLILVPIARVGHGDATCQAADQPHADRQPRQTHHCQRGAQTPLDLREYTSHSFSGPIPCFFIFFHRLSYSLLHDTTRGLAGWGKNSMYMYNHLFNMSKQGKKRWLARVIHIMSVSFRQFMFFSWTFLYPDKFQLLF